MHKKIMRWQDISSEPHNRKKINIFLVCLILSSAFWISIKLSRENAGRFEYQVSLNSVPENIIITARSDKSFTMNVQSTGMRLLNLNFRHSSEKMETDFSSLQSLRRNDNTYYYITRRQAELRFSQRFDIPQEALRAGPDTIFFRTEPAFTGKLPVVPQIKISFRPGFKQYAKTEIRPDSVEVKGPKHLQDSILYLLTDSLIASNADKQIENNSKIFSSQYHNQLEIMQGSVLVTIPVEEFTEERIELPLHINCDDIDSLTQLLLFPEKINLHYLVALKDMKNIRSEMFSVQVNCPDSISWARNRLKVHPSEKPDKVEILRMVPSEVEFIVISNQTQL